MDLNILKILNNIFQTLKGEQQQNKGGYSSRFADKSHTSQEEFIKKIKKLGEHKRSASRTAIPGLDTILSENSTINQNFYNMLEEFGIQPAKSLAIGRNAVSSLDINFNQFTIPIKNAKHHTNVPKRQQRPNHGRRNRLR